MGSLKSAQGGGGKSNSSGRSSSHSETRESPLSQEQLAIVQERRKMFNDLFYPELAQGMQADKPGTQSFNAMFAPAVSAINQSYENLQQKSQQNLAQRGLLNDAGTSMAIAAQNDRARQQSLADAYYQTLVAGANKKMDYLKMGIASSPTPTTAAPYHQVSDSSSRQRSSAWNMHGGFELFEPKAPIPIPGAQK